MAPARRSLESLRQALSLLEAHDGNITKAAAASGLPYETFRHTVHAARARLKDETIREPLANYDEAWTRLSHAIGVAKDRYAGPARPKKAGKRIRVCAAGDFHVPFHDRDAVAELVAKEAGQTDLLVIGGDFGDAYAASTFAKYESVPFKEELAETKACLDILSGAFPAIKYLRGSNHMDRVEKRLRERLDAELVEAILYMSGGELSPDLVLAKRYENVSIDCWVTPDGQRVPWLMVVGDVAFSHAERYSRVPGATLRSVEEWLDDHGGALGLPDIRAVVQFHTHAMALVPWRADKILIEPGCMAQTMGYQFGARLAGRPQRVGYVTFEMEDGRIDFDSIRLRWLNRERERVA